MRCFTVNFNFLFLPENKLNSTYVTPAQRDEDLDAPLRYAPARLNNQPVYALLVQFPAAFFFGALLTDIAYVQTVNYIWETFSIWLLTAGCIFAGLAGIAGLVIFVRNRHVRNAYLAWPYVITCVLVLVLSVFNAFIHSRDGYTAVVPAGLTLSAIVVLLMIVATWMGWNRHQHVVVRTGVSA